MKIETQLCYLFSSVW